MLSSRITETALSDSHEIGVNLSLALDKAGFVTNTTVVDLLTDNAAIFTGGDFNALVKAVTTDQNTELLSRPEHVNHGQGARLHYGRSKRALF